jgi:hypothetical protein
MQLSRSLILKVRLALHGRAIHAPHGRAIHNGTFLPFVDVRYLVAIEGEADIHLRGQRLSLGQILV